MYLNRAMRSDECPYDLNKIKFLPLLYDPSCLSLSSRTVTDHREQQLTMSLKKTRTNSNVLFSKKNLIMLTPNKTHSHALVDILYLCVDFMVVYLRENGFCQEVPLFLQL